MSESKEDKRTARESSGALQRLVRHEKEEVNIVEMRDGKVRICYWNKANGETQIFFSKKIAKIIQAELRKIIYA